MSAAALSRWRLTAEVGLWRAGWGLPAAVLLAIAGALVWALAVLPQRHLRAELDARSLRLASEPAPAMPRSGTDLQWQAWQQLRAGLPVEPSADRLLARMLALARAHGVSLEQADFQYRPDPEMQWLQLTALVPIRGPYPAARRFLEATLREHPHVALDEITFKRDHAGASQPEVVARFSAWFQAEPSTRNVTGAPAATATRSRASEGWGR